VDREEPIVFIDTSAALAALWLGILTAISPCPLATNVAALSFLAKQVADPKRVLWGGMAYTLGRIFTYVVLAVILVSGLLSVPAISFFLQKHMNQLMGPILVLTGAVLLGLIPMPALGLGGGERLQKVGASGVAGSFVMGAGFAMAFCPVSAALFFMGLIPLALKDGSRFLLPSLYGFGTALPVAILAVAVAFGVRKAAGAYNRMTAMEKWMRLVTGWLFVGLGVYLTVKHVFLRS
jgi:threonine/homoserine/homoserine lactone efflux protein